jgi:hypothetical protein
MEILKDINWLDIAVLILVLRAIYIGSKRGLTAELFNFLGILVSLVAAVLWYGRTADVLIINFKLPVWLSQFLCFVIIAQLIRMLFKYGLALLLKVLNVQFIPQLERIGGGIMGLARGIVLSGIIILAIGIIPNIYLRESIELKSFTGNFLLRSTERIYESLTFWLGDDQKQTDIFSLSADDK